MRSLSNRLAHVERPEQRVAIHWNKISITPPSHDPVVRTSPHREIETEIQEGVREGGGLHQSGSETLCVPGKTVTHGDEGGYGEEASQHPRWDSERDLWREGGER